MNEKAREAWMNNYYLVVTVNKKKKLCMYSLVNNEMNGSKKKNEIVEVQNRIDGHKYNHKWCHDKKSESKITMTMMMIRGKN